MALWPPPPNTPLGDGYAGYCIEISTILLKNKGQSNLNQTLFHSYSEMKVSQLLATSKDPCFRKTFALPVYNWALK